MANEEIKSKTSIGISSLILIFIILCLATFGLLALSSAKGDLALARRNAEAVGEYYKADGLGEEFLKMTDQTLDAVFLDSQQDVEVYKAALTEKLGDYYQEETGMIVTDISMDRGQALHIELVLTCSENQKYQIQNWKVINLEDYEIDDSRPVWTGQ